jgi:uncharacterized membrane protein YgaE (UPF0421/DUF939 family)
VDLRTFIRGMQLALRASVAAGVSIALAQLFGLEHPIYSFLSAVIVTDLAPSQSRRLGTHRLLSTVVGALWGAALNQILPAGAWAVGLGILIAMLTCQLLRSPEGAKVAGFTCGIIVLQNSPDPWAGAFSRLIETALGVSVALLVSYLPKLIRIDESDNKIA